MVFTSPIPSISMASDATRPKNSGKCFQTKTMAPREESHGWCHPDGEALWSQSDNDEVRWSWTRQSVWATRIFLRERACECCFASTTLPPRASGASS
jgi:hypothetical protein